MNYNYQTSNYNYCKIYIKNHKMKHHYKNKNLMNSQTKV